MRVGNCHCWRVKQAARIKPANSRAEARRQPKLVYTCHVAKSGGKLSNRNGFSSGSRCWQPVEDVDIFWRDYFCSQMGKCSSSQNAFELVQLFNFEASSLQLWVLRALASFSAHMAGFYTHHFSCLEKFGKGFIFIHHLPRLAPLCKDAHWGMKAISY